MNTQLTLVLGEATFDTLFGVIAATAYRNDFYGGDAVCFSGIEVGADRYAASYRACDGSWCVLDATDPETLRALDAEDAMRVVVAAGLVQLIEANRSVLGLGLQSAKNKRTAA